MLLFSLLLYHIILNQMKAQEPCSASDVVDQRVKVWGELDVLLQPRPTWALAEGNSDSMAEGRESTQRAEQPQESVFQIHCTPNHNGFLREQKETWRIMDKPDTVRRAKEWRRFFSIIVFVVLYDIFSLKTTTLPF